MSEYHHQDRSASSNAGQSQSPPKSLFIQALDAMAILVSIVITLLVAPSLFAWSEPYFVGFMSATFVAGFNYLYSFIWFMLCVGLLFSSSLSFLSIFLIRRATSSIIRGIK